MSAQTDTQWAEIVDELDDQVEALKLRLAEARAHLMWIGGVCREEMDLEYTERMRKVLLSNIAEVADRAAIAAKGQASDQ